ncbi:MAG: hypothetical protein U5R48_02275 [Gammaproteobacteria bacterium]|nr:hypothetical protein [Gammaproteobacteria bacterium]
MADQTTERVIETGPEDADAAVILLHGLGDSGEGLAGLAPHLQLPEGPGSGSCSRTLRSGR